jgi:3-deoxy-D-arabino-heptulosonate 7-phosphate (DAHP) synthase
MRKKRGRKGSRKMRGGMYALSPSAYDGQGVGTSGVGLQFVAGNAN